MEKSPNRKIYSGLQAKPPLQTFEVTTTKSPGLYWDRLEIVFKIFRLMGYMPYKINDGKEKIESSPKAWLWVGFAILVQLVLVVITDYMRSDVKYWDTYDKALESLIRLLFTNNIIFILPTWWESNKIIKYINEWAIFLNELEKITGTHVTCFSKHKFRKVLIFTSIVSFAFLLVDQFTLQGGFNLFLLFTYFVNVFESLLFSLFCAANCIFIVQTARCFKQHFFIVLKTKCDYTLVDKYRHLWLRLRNIAVNFPEAFKGCIGIHIFMNLLSLIFSIYTWTTAALYDRDITRVIGLFTPIFWSFCTLMAICEFSDWVTREIGYKLISEMLSFNLSTHNYELLISDEMDTLFDTFDGNPPDFVIHGCLTLKRGLLISMLSNIVTYIIVLLQFDVRAK